MKIRYVNNTDDLVAFGVLHSGADWARNYRLWRWLVPSAVLTGTLLYGAVTGEFDSLAGAAGFTLLYLLFFPRSHLPALKRALRKQFEAGRNDTLLCEHELELVDGLLIERTDVNESRTKLSAIEDVRSSENHSIIYTGSSMGHVIPRGRLLSGDHDAFVSAVRAACGLQP